jgi:putative membrane protein
VTRISKMLFAVSLGSALAIIPAAAQDTTSQTSSKSETSAKTSAGTKMSDTDFLQKAAQGGLAEVELGQLAQQKASSPEVKQFGERMVNDHTKANDQLKQVAEKEHVNLPQDLDAKDKMTKARLEKLSGEQFDRAYMRDMVKDHRKDISEFQRESQNAQDPGLKNFVTQTLPTLREHLKQAEKIAPTTMAKSSPKTERSSAQ